MEMTEHSEYNVEEHGFFKKVGITLFLICLAPIIRFVIFLEDLWEAVADVWR